MFNVTIMLVVAIAFSITMLGPWGFIKDAANVTESRQITSFLVYVASLWGLALVVFPGVFMLVSKAANRMGGGQTHDRTLTLRLAYILVPIGIFAWIAFSLPALMVNYSYILSVLSDPLGLGWNLFGTANIEFNPFYPEWIPLIQGIILLTGLYFGLSRGHTAIKELVKNPQLRAKTMIIPGFFAIFVVNVLLKLYMG